MTPVGGKTLTDRQPRGSREVPVRWRPGWHDDHVDRGSPEALCHRLSTALLWAADFELTRRTPGALLQAAVALGKDRSSRRRDRTAVSDNALMDNVVFAATAHIVDESKLSAI